MESNRKQEGKSRYSKKPGSESGSNYSRRKDDPGSGNNERRGGRFSGKDNNSGYSRGRREGNSGYSRDKQEGDERYSKSRREEKPEYPRNRRNENPGYSRGTRDGNKEYPRGRGDGAEGYSRGRRDENRDYPRERRSYRPKSEEESSYSRGRFEQKSRPYNKTGKSNYKKDKDNTKPTSEEIRLNRYIANSGVCSRREADELIQRGEIYVNGKQVTELGVKVKPSDKVTYKEKRLVPEHKVYILMNKPKGYVTTVEDPHAEHTVIDLLGDNFPERVYPVGRLDKDTTGVLLLTNDGDLTKKLTHPKFERRKIYHVFLNKEITKNDVFALAEGVDVDGEMVAADAVSSPDPDDRTQLGIEIHSGQNRIVRRMMETLGYKVKKLDRVYFAGLTKKNVQRGKWRFLTDKEIVMLKRGAF